MNFEIVQPVEVVQHESGAKTCSVPVMQITINPKCFGGELAAGVKEPAIVLQIVHSHFEASFDQLGPQFCRVGIAPLRNKIEGRSKAQVLFQLHQFLALL